METSPLKIGPTMLQGKNEKVQWLTIFTPQTNRIGKFKIPLWNFAWLAR
jgi:hypothetical protein